MPASPFRRLLVVFAAGVSSLAAHARENINLNREWKFLLGDQPGAEAPAHDVAKWSDIHLPHSFSLPYFMWTSFYTGHGWYRKTLEAPAEWRGKRVALEFEGVFQESEIFLNGVLVGRHRGGYVGFEVDLTKALRPGTNILAVKVANLWRPDLAPRAGDHAFSGGIYRDVRLVVADPLHVAWQGTFVTTPTLAGKRGAESTVNIKTEVRNDSETDRVAMLRTDILDPAGEKVASVTSRLAVPARGAITFDQTTPPVEKPRLWHPDHPSLYRAVSTVSAGEGAPGRDQDRDTYETVFGFRWVEWTADRGFFLNGEHTYLRGANVHQDHAGWGDAVSNAAFERDVRMVKEAGFNFIRGSHYPKDPAFAAACDRLGVLWLSENIFWGIGGRHADGAWGASAYPVTPEHEAGFEESVLASLRAMIRIHRNSPSIMAWSTSNEPFFSDRAVMGKVRGLLAKSVALARELDPARPVGVGGAQRPLNQDRIDRIGDFAAYNGDGATQPPFQDPGVGSLVSEYGSVIAERPGPFDPGWGDLKTQIADGLPRRFPWRAGEAVWCMFDHGTHAGLNLARMGIVDYFRVPKRAFYWYRENYAGVPAPAWPSDGKPARIALAADKTTISAPDGTDDVQLSITLIDADGKPVNAAVPVTLDVVSGPGEFPTGPSITFSPPGKGDASDIAIRDGQASIAFRSYHAGATTIRASSPGLSSATLVVVTDGCPAYVDGVTPPAPSRPYARFTGLAKAPAAAVGEVLALNRPTKASTSATASSSGMANDGDVSTAWRAASPGPNQSWEVFLEVAYDVDRVTLVFPEEREYRYALDVTAGGGQPWRTVIDQSDATGAFDRRSHAGDFGRGLVGIRVRFFPSPGELVPAISEILVGGSSSSRLPAGRLCGTVIGTPGSWENNPAAERTAVFDGDFDTFFDAPASADAWVGLDLGATGAALVTGVCYAPRAAPGNDSFPSRMVGGKIQGANRPDFDDAVDLLTISVAPPSGAPTRKDIVPAGPFRYLRYLSPQGGNCNLSELAFLGRPKSSP